MCKKSNLATSAASSFYGTASTAVCTTACTAASNAITNNTASTHDYSADSMFQYYCQ